MRITQIMWRWLPTFLAFPIGGLLADLSLGPIRNPLLATVSGATIGCILGLAQWWALKPAAVTFDWAWSTAVGLMLSSPLAWVLVSFETSVGALAVWGVVAGSIVGLGQAVSQRLTLVATVSWAALVSGAWGLAWFISANVIVDEDANYAVFGSTGAIVATAFLGFFINPVLTKRK